MQRFLNRSQSRPLLPTGSLPFLYSQHKSYARRKCPERCPAERKQHGSWAAALDNSQPAGPARTGSPAAEAWSKAEGQPPSPTTEGAAAGRWRVLVARGAPVTRLRAHERL